MNFRERKIAYEQLKGASHLEADKALLAKLKPSHNLLSRKMNPERLQAEILYELLGLDNITRDMVVKNRRKMQEQGVDFSLIGERCGDLTAQLEKAQTPDDANQLMSSIKFVSAQLPDDLKAEVLSKAKEVMPDFIKAEAEKALLQTNIDEATQQEMAKLVRDLGIATKDMKAKTIRPALVAYVNELTDENEDLQEKNADLEEQNEELQDKINEADQKKS